MVEHVNGEESVSRFLIAPILDQDGGEVVCEVTNRFGRDSKIFLLSIEGIKKKIFFTYNLKDKIVNLNRTKKKNLTLLLLLLRKLKMNFTCFVAMHTHYFPFCKKKMTSFVLLDEFIHFLHYV